MGNTFRLRAGGVYAVEGVFGDGRASAVRGQVARRRSDDRRLPGVWHLPQDRLQGLCPLSGARRRGVERPLAPAGALCQPVAAPDRESHRQAHAGEAPLGCAQDSGAPGAAWTGTCAFRPRAPSMPCYIGTAWSRRCASASTSSAFGPATRSKTAATSACT